MMFGAPMRQYLGARATIEDSFSDLKTHQVLIYAAMRDALDALFDDLAPRGSTAQSKKTMGLAGWWFHARRNCGISMLSAGAPRRSGLMVSFWRHLWRCSPRRTIGCKKGAGDTAGRVAANERELGGIVEGKPGWRRL